MNFISCRVEQNRQHPGLRLESGQEKVYILPVARRASVLEGWQGREVIRFDPKTQGRIAAR